MLLLFETPAGFSLFKVKDEKKLDDVEVRDVIRSVVFLSAGGRRRERIVVFTRISSFADPGPRVGAETGTSRDAKASFVVVVPSIAGFGDRSGTYRSREEDRFDPREKGKARARIERARTGGRRLPIDRVWNETTTVGLGSVRVYRGVFFLTDDEFAWVFGTRVETSRGFQHGGGREEARLHEGF